MVVVSSETKSNWSAFNVPLESWGYGSADMTYGSSTATYDYTTIPTNQLNTKVPSVWAPTNV